MQDIFFNFSKAMRKVFLLFTCFVGVANLKLLSPEEKLEMSKQEQFHVRKSYKVHKSLLSCIGNFEKTINLSRIH